MREVHTCRHCGHDAKQHDNTTSQDCNYLTVEIEGPSLKYCQCPGFQKHDPDRMCDCGHHWDDHGTTDDVTETICQDTQCTCERYTRGSR